MLDQDIGKNPTNYRCIHSVYPEIILEKVLKFKLKSKSGVAVFLGTCNGEKRIIKWHQGRKYPKKRRTALEEQEFYLWLHKQGCTTAKVYPGYKLAGENVLVMESLHPLREGSEDPVRMGLDVLHQLQYIHERCVHSGIKPDNILRVDGNPNYRYLLIDFGSISSHRMKDGYLRKSYPVDWAVQDRHIPNQITYPEHDYMELARTLKALARNSKEKKIFKKFTKMANHKVGYQPLFDYLLNLHP